MNKHITRYLLLIFGFAGQSYSLKAQAPENNPISTAIPFLRQAADARSAGMGDAVMATSPDANASFYNGAKTVFNERNFGVGLTYSNLLQELNIDKLYQLSMAGYYKLDDNQAISLGVRYFSKGDFTFRDDQEQVLQNFRPSDLAIEAGYSRKLSKRLGLGLNVRFINSKLSTTTGNNPDYKTGNSVAADLSVYYASPSGLNFGAALSNLGNKIDYGGTKSFIPAKLAIGAAYKITIDPDNNINFAIDASKLMVPTPPDPSDSGKVANYEKNGVVGSWFSSFGDAPGGFKEELREVQLGFGTEYSYKDIFNLRAGYVYQSKYKSNGQYITLGAGLGYKVVKLNFSYLQPTGAHPTFSPLLNTFRLSLLFHGKN